MNKLHVRKKCQIFNVLLFAFCSTASLANEDASSKVNSTANHTTSDDSFLERIANFFILGDDNSSHSLNRTTRHLITSIEQSLSRYQGIHEQGGWPTISIHTKLELGDTGPAVYDLVQRLRISQDLQSTPCKTSNLSTHTATCTFDADLENAVKKFQARHGLKSDGIVGSNTLKQLNTPVEQRIKQLELNLFRIMQFPGIEDQEYVYVNIPEYRLRYINQGKILVENKVVVGKPRWATPSMSDKIEKFVINPNWRIPQSIASKEIAPKVAEQPDYLAQKGIEIRKDSYIDDELVDPNSIDWDEITPWNFDYFLVEKPHDENPLGEVKYLFPNKQAIYVHDTPHKQWFDESQRAASHGCIRMDNPFSLAEAFAKQNNRFDLLARIHQVRESDKTESFYLDNPIPIHLVYWTAWVDNNNQVNFRDDIYQRDEPEYLALKQQQINLPKAGNAKLIGATSVSAP